MICIAFVGVGNYNKKQPQDAAVFHIKVSADVKCGSGPVCQIPWTIKEESFS